MTDQPLPKMSYEQQQSYNALAAIDAAAQPHRDGEDLITTIARANLQRQGLSLDPQKMESLRSILADFLHWYLWDHNYPSSVSGSATSIVENYLAENLQ